LDKLLAAINYIFIQCQRELEMLWGGFSVDNRGQACFGDPKI
jgi:hypothetical protein